MTEQQIRDGFERLDGALAPPLDVQDRVDHRVAVRRRRRRTGVAGVTALALAATVGTAVALSGGDDPGDDSIAVDQPSGPQSTLVMTRADGSTVAFPDVEVSCEPPVPGGAMGPPEGRIWMYSPMEIAGDPESDDARVTAPFVYFEGIVEKLQGEPTLELPISGAGNSTSYPLTVFIADSQGVDGNGNELSSSAGDAAGTVRVVEASCDPTPVLRLELATTLGSEENQESAELAGAVR